MALIISIHRQICHQRFAAKKTNVDKKQWQNVLPVNYSSLWHFHCVLYMQYLMLKSTLSGTLFVFYSVLNLPSPSNLSKKINYELCCPTVFCQSCFCSDLVCDCSMSSFFSGAVCLLYSLVIGKGPASPLHERAFLGPWYWGSHKGLR